MGCLRLLLAVSVLAAHLGESGFRIAGGPPAVQAFFAISGFYMSLVLNEKYAADRRGTLIFLGNRVLRLWPTYLLVLVLTIGVMLWRDPESPFFHTLARLDAIRQLGVWLANVFVFGLDALLFFAIDPATGAVHFSARAGVPGSMTALQLVPQGWSLSLEAYFYLLAPWLLRQRLRWLLAVIATSLACRFLLARGFGFAGYTKGPFYYQFFPNELATFLFGAVAYRVYRWIGEDNGVAKRYGWFSLAAIVVFTLVYLRLPIPSKSLLYALFVIVNVPTLFIASSSARWDRWIGELSYPVYLGHGLVIHLLEGIGTTNPVWILAATLGVAVLVVAAIEQPIDRLRQRLARRGERLSTAASDK